MIPHDLDRQNHARIRVALFDDWQHIAETSVHGSALNDRAEVVFFHQPLGRADSIVEALQTFDIALAICDRTPFTPGIIARLRRLKFFNIIGRHARRFGEMARRGIPVSIASGSEDGKDAAEHALALMLSAVRRIRDSGASTKSGPFLENKQSGFQMGGKTLDIRCAGLIGGHLANCCRSIGFTSEKAARAIVETMSAVELFRRSDIIAVHPALSRKTTKIVGSPSVLTRQTFDVSDSLLLKAVAANRLGTPKDEQVEYH